MVVVDEAGGSVGVSIVGGVGIGGVVVHEGKG